ncbi:MAG: ABC transporter substrate-binding protein, partial [Marmoricola sp.]
MAQQTNRFRAVTGVAVMAVVALAAAGCGGSSGSSGGNSKGPITFVTGKDNANVWAPTVKRWNAAHPSEKVTIKEQSDQANQQHDDIVQNMQAKNAGYDLVTVDVIWTAEFAAKGWLVPLKGANALDTSKMLKPTVVAATYNNTLFAAPFASDGGMLYYRKDLVKTPPKTFDELWKDCKIAKQNGMGCYAGQFFKYEGLTVNATEVMNTFGGKVVDASGKPTVNSAESKAGLQMLVDHYKSGDIPREAITYQEEQGRQSFEDGKLLFMRNWPYVYNLATSDGSSKVKNKFAVAPLPGVNGPGASSLGGHSIAIGAYSKHQATALAFLKFIEAPAQQTFFLKQGSLAPVLASIYDDTSLYAKAPYLPTLKQSIASAVPRPVTPFYPAVTKAITDNAYAALQGQKSVDQA